MSQRMGDSVWSKLKKTEAQMVALRLEAEERRCRTKASPCPKPTTNPFSNPLSWEFSRTSA